MLSPPRNSSPTETFVMTAPRVVYPETALCKNRWLSIQLTQRQPDPTANVIWIILRFNATRGSTPVLVHPPQAPPLPHTSGRVRTQHLLLLKKKPSISSPALRGSLVPKKFWVKIFGQRLTTN